MTQEDARGKVLLQVRVAPRYGWIGIFGGPLLVIVAMVPGDGLSWPFRLIALLLGTATTVLAFRQIMNQDLMMEVTDLGISLCPRTGVVLSRSLSQTLFIPWSRVQLMYYFRAKDVPRQLRWTSAWGGVSDPLIVLRVRVDQEWPPSGAMRHDFLTRQGRADEIYVNAGEGSPAGEQLWAHMAGITRQLGLAAILTEPS